MNNFALKAVLLGSLVASSTFGGAFVGLEGDYSLSTKLKFSYDNTNDKTEFKDKFGLVGVKAGYNFGLVRAYAGYYQICKEKDASIHVDGVGNFEYKNQRYLADIDITPAITDNIKLVAGAYSGLSVLKFNANGKISGNTISGRTPLMV